MIRGIAGVGSQVELIPVIAHAAATASELVPIWYAKFPCRVKAAYHVSPAITGADTNTTHLNLINAGTDGTGTDEVGNIDYVMGTDQAASDPQSFGLTAFNLAAEETLVLQYEKVGTGLAIPAGAIVLELEPM